MLSRFEVMRFQLTRSSKIEVFPSPNFYGSGRKKLKVGDQPWHHPCIVCTFRGDPLRDGRDPLSRKSGLKERNKQYSTAAEHICSRLAGYARRMAQLCIHRSIVMLNC